MFQAAHRRIALRQALMVLLAGLLLGLVLTLADSGMEAAQRSRDVQAQVTALVRMASEPMAQAAYELDAELAGRTARGLFGNHYVQAIEVRDDFGDILVDIRRDSGSPQPWQEALRELLSWRTNWSQPLSSHGQAVGRLDVRLDEHLLARDLASFLLRSMARDAILSICLAAALALLLHRNLARPLVRLSRSLDEVNPANPSSRRLKTPPGHETDELGRLAQSINSLLEKIEEGIDRRAMIERDLRRAKNVAEASSRAKSRFLGAMSHEIRTPLNGLMGMLQLLKSDPAASRRRDYVEQCLQASRGLLRILSDVLELASLEAGDDAPYVAPLNPAEMIREAARDPQHDAEFKKIRLALEIDPALNMQMMGDSARLRRMLAHLIGNAVKFTDQGEVLVRAWLIPTCESEHGRWIHIMIRDQGEGIPDDSLKTAFESFTQLDASLTRRHDGAGLGLTIVKRLAALLDVRLCMVSLDSGLEVHVSLRLKPLQNPPSA